MSTTKLLPSPISSSWGPQRPLTSWRTHHTSIFISLLVMCVSGTVLVLYATTSSLSSCPCPATANGENLSVSTTTTTTTTTQHLFHAGEVAALREDMDSCSGRVKSLETELNEVLAKAAEEKRKLREEMAAARAEAEEQERKLKARVKELEASLADEGVKLEAVKALAHDLEVKQQELEKPKKAEQEEDDEDPGSGRIVREFTVAPSSSAWCYGDNPENRYCKFRNLCYDKGTDEFFIVKTNRTIEENVPENLDYLMEPTTVAGTHWWSFSRRNPFDENDEKSKRLRDARITYEEDLHFFFHRWELENIMHYLHDDVFGLYFLMKEMVGNTARKNSGEPFSLDHHLVMLDWWGPTNTVRAYEFLTKHPLKYHGDLAESETEITCFRDAVVGQKRTANFYHYGVGKFTGKQGPIPDKQVNGRHVREVANFFMQRLGLDMDDLGAMEYPVPTLPPSTSKAADKHSTTLSQESINKHIAADEDKQDTIIIFSRKGNRKITNEDELAAKLSDKFNLPTKFLRMEEHSFDEQVRAIRKAKVIISVHGSMLIMAMFARPGTTVIELYPYAVPSKNYTPYRTMSHLPGMNLRYYAWENNHPENTMAYPDRDWRHGGIRHLSEEDQKKIETARWVPDHEGSMDPYWLHRIYQDTKVEVTEIENIIEESFREGK
ncbi:Protein O-linked-mannose beta-1,4-N-acetylglucosaminyltransferase 2 [Quaeritorhiza haematococci]|nr:Protein O-linked-mannose beta-1,4-N-acetylglucosaminyltransferase 2 [Quaeritorhiza haematococci]